MNAPGLPDIHDVLIEHNPLVLSGSDVDLIAAELSTTREDAAELVTSCAVIESLSSAALNAVAETAKDIPVAARRVLKGNVHGRMLLVGPAPRLTALAHRLTSARDTVSVGLALAHAIEAANRRDYALRVGAKTLDLSGCACVMGILNVTPDSFSDGGKFLNTDAAVAQGVAMAEEGASIIDVGGESTRPGSEPVSPKEQIKRVVPVIRKLAEKGAVVSIDTASAKVAEAALDAGAGIINDVTALSGDEHMAALAAKRDCPLILMHMLGEPRTMQESPTYADVVSDVARFLRERIADAIRAGVDEEQIVIDPGIGFGKTVAHNLMLTRRLAEFRSLGRPILMGFSRKSTIGKVLNKSVEERIFGSLATAVTSVLNGAQIVRVHDVAETTDVVRMTHALMTGTAGDDV